MPVLPTQNPTLADVAKRLDPDGKIAMSRSSICACS